MKQGIQTNFPHDALRRFGCYFFSLMKWLEVHDGAAFTNDDLLRIYNEAGRNGLLRASDCFIQDAVGLLNFALGGRKYRDIQRDVRTAPPSGTAIRRLVRNGERETHFTVQIAGIEWDPLDPTRAAAKTWAFHSFRVPV